MGACWAYHVERLSENLRLGERIFLSNTKGEIQSRLLDSLHLLKWPHATRHCHQKDWLYLWWAIVQTILKTKVSSSKRAGGPNDLEKNEKKNVAACTGWAVSQNITQNVTTGISGHRRSLPLPPSPIITHIADRKKKLKLCCKQTKKDKCESILLQATKGKLLRNYLNG